MGPQVQPKCFRHVALIYFQKMLQVLTSHTSKLPKKVLKNTKNMTPNSCSVRPEKFHPYTNWKLQCEQKSSSLPPQIGDGRVCFVWGHGLGSTDPALRTRFNDGASEVGSALVIRSVPYYLGLNNYQEEPMSPPPSPSDLLIKLSQFNFFTRRLSGRIFCHG